MRWSRWVPIGGLAAALVAYFAWGKRALAQTHAAPSAPFVPYSAGPVQEALSLLGYDVPQSGVYDAQTIAAVKLYQQRNGLAVDGIVGPQTVGKLRQDLEAIGLADL